jgi:hypothetical protein
MDAYSPLYSMRCQRWARAMAFTTALSIRGGSRFEIDFPSGAMTRLRAPLLRMAAPGPCGPLAAAEVPVDAHAARLLPSAALRFAASRRYPRLPSRHSAGETPATLLKLRLNAASDL